MQDERFTIVGADGYIGSRLCLYLRQQGAQVLPIDRFSSSDHATENLGHVLFAAGVTADFRVRPFDTMNAHVGTIAEILQTATFKSFLYLSSTRVYQGAASTTEDEHLRLFPGDPLQLYNASKIAGESLCLALDKPGIRVARLSNVYGADDPSSNFLIEIVRAAVVDGHIRLRSNPESEKDFISIADVIAILPRLALHGAARLYNVASGRNTRYADLVRTLQSQTGCTFSVDAGSPLVSFPQISINRLSNEFSVAPVLLTDDIANLIKTFESMHI